MIRPTPGRGHSTMLPLAYLGAAAVAFMAAAIAVPWLARELAGHYYHPRVMALTHTITLGWITLTIMGASYQLIPIVLERSVWSERLARWQLVALVVGIAGLVGHFFIAEWRGLLWAAAAVGLGALAHVVNVAWTLRGLRRWTFTARLLVMGLAGFLLTSVFGLVLGLNHVVRVLPVALLAAVHAHFHLALLGWVAPMVFGVAARVYPMFLLAPEPRGWPGRAQAWGLALGVPATVCGLLQHPPLLAAGAVAIAVAVAGHLAWVVDIARARKRPALDWGLRLVFTGTALLVPSTVLGLALAFDLVGGPRVGLAYAVLVLGGWASLTIVGMMLKIVPFLVWYRAYGPLVGRASVPTLAQLSWPAAEGAAWALLTVGVVALACAVYVADATWILGAGLLVAAGAIAFGATLGRVVLHLRPRGAGVSLLSAVTR
jgi:cytochrome c/quinol oxidase subunit I